MFWHLMRLSFCPDHLMFGLILGGARPGARWTPLTSP